MLLLGAKAAYADGRFSATFDDPPPVVSRYKPQSELFSVALGAKPYSILSEPLQFKPLLKSSSHSAKSLTFVTPYAAKGELIPVSVDAELFNAYRTSILLRQRFSSSVSKSIAEAQSGRKRSGLSVGIDLPKRFDKIFGEGGGNLRVSGYRRITLSGRSQWTDGAAAGLVQPSRFPSLNMEQISRFEIAGTIGTKISVKVSQDNQTDIPLANRIQLRYKGDEDDILKTIEAGNTTLDLKRTQFVGYSSTIQGLFGLKTEAQLGNLTLTAIASQEKGSSERATINAGGLEDATWIRDLSYAEGRLYDLGYADSSNIDGIGFKKGDFVLSVQVFEVLPKDISAQNGTNPIPATLYINTFDRTLFPEESSAKDSLEVKELTRDNFTLEQDTIKNLHYLQFTSSRREAMGVFMIIKRADGTIQTVGDITGSNYILKYIRTRPGQYFRSTSKTWPLMWRNVYSVPKAGGAEDLSLKIFKGKAGQEGTVAALEYQLSTTGTPEGNFIEILGLDQYNGSAQQPDGLIDTRREIYRSDWGLLIFPSRTPFNSDTTFVDENGTATNILSKTARNSIIYSDVPGSQASANASQYYIQYSSKTRSSIIRLNRTNIIEGSERVMLNGQLLTKGEDYNIQYDFGQLTLISDVANDPNADLKVEFEYAPFLTLAKKTLFGARAEYEWSRDLSFGTTVLYKSDKAQDRKPRVGQETSKGLVLDFDMGFRIYPGFLTKAINALPALTTEAPSTMQFSAEVAQSRPNPNVGGEAYIDDFESALEQVSIGMSYQSWTLAALPQQLVGLGYNRSKMLWHNTHAIAFSDVYEGERPQGEGTLTPFRMIFRPAKVNADTSGADTSDTKAWAGILRHIGNRIDKSRVQLFEMRVKGRTGKIHLDFGQITEDVNGNNAPDTEDKDRNKAITEEEDIGIDGLSDGQEPGYNLVTNPDPNGDNWFNGKEGVCPLPPGQCTNVRFNVEDPRFYEWLNGTEGNRVADGIQTTPDKETFADQFQTLNDYYSFTIDLASDSFLVPGSEKILPDGTNWRTYRLPIRDSRALTDSIGKPDWDFIRYVRVWFNTEEFRVENDTVEVANWYFVQSNWQDSVHVDSANLNLPEQQQSKFVVASVSDEENVNFTPPPGVEAYFDRTNNVTEAQRALSLSYENLQPNDTGIAKKNLVSIERYSGYRHLQMYVHGPITSVSDSVRFFLRAGRDSVNFYEYSTFVHPGWDERNFVDIDFNAITGIKDSALRAKDSVNAFLNVTSGNYRINGRPSINDISYFAAGVVNESSQPITGEVWLDELRVTDVRKDIGTAYRFSVNGTAADLFNYNFGLEQKDPYFRGLSTANRAGASDNLGSGSTNSAYNYGVTFNADKFLPKSWTARLPISYSFSQTRLVPLLRTNSDIVLPEDVRLAEQTFSNRRSISISESFQRKGKSPLFNVLLNRQKVSYSYARSMLTSVNNPRNFSENYNVNASYDMGLKNLPRLSIFGWAKDIPLLKRLDGTKLGIYPQSWDWSGRFDRSIQISEDRNGKPKTSLSRSFNGRTSLSYEIFQNLSTSYSMNTVRDLADIEGVSLKPGNFKLGLETNYGQTFSASYDPKLLKFLTTALSYGSTYGDVYDRTSETRAANLARNWSVNGTFNHMLLLGKPWKSTNRPSASRVAQNTPNPSDTIITDSTVIDSTLADSNRIQAKKEEPKVDGRPIYDPPLTILRLLTGWIKPITYKYAKTYNNSTPGMLTRSSYGYQFGFKDDPDGLRSSDDPRSPFSSEGVSYDLGSGFRLLGGLLIDVRFRQSITRDLFRVGPRQEQISTSWPDVSVSIQKFTTLPIIKPYVNKFIEVFAPRTGYSRQTRETVELDGNFTSNRTTTENFNPLLSVNFKLFRALSMSSSYALTKTLTEQFGTFDGKRQSNSVGKQKRLAFTAKYSFSAPGGISVPLFGKVKFKSQMALEVTARFSGDQSETIPVVGIRRLTTDKSDFSIAPTISYTFSQQIQGGLSAMWQDTSDKLGRNTHVRQLQIWTEIKF